MLKLDKVHRGPHLSTLVASSISREIAQGRLKPGDQLPTEQALAQTFGVSRNVVREAIARLRSEGRIWSQQGRGAFVSDVPNTTVLTISRTASETFAIRRELMSGSIPNRASEGNNGWWMAHGRPPASPSGIVRQRTPLITASA